MTFIIRQVYRGYILVVFVFSVTMLVSALVHFFFSVKDFSGIVLPRILKFGTNIEYDLLCCVEIIRPVDGLALVRGICDPLVTLSSCIAVNMVSTGTRISPFSKI